MKVNLKLIEELCDKYRDSGCPSLYVKSTITEKHLRNSVKHFPIVGAKTIYLLYDSTLLGSGKTGLAICDNGIFYKNSMDIQPEYGHFTWEEFEEVSIFTHEDDIYFDENYKIRYQKYRVHITYSEARYKLEELLEMIKDIVVYSEGEEAQYESDVSENDDENDKHGNANYDDNALSNSNNNYSGSCKTCGAAIPIGAVECIYCGRQVEGVQNLVQQQANISINEDKSYINSASNVNIDTDIHRGSPKSKSVALLLCFFLGGFGIHKFYEGKIGLGILYFFTAGLFLIGVIVDFIILLTKPSTYYV